jgi:hypothetical protein
LHELSPKRVLPLASRSNILATARDIGADPDFLALAKTRHPDAFREWDRIMSGNVQRNDAVVIAAIKLLWQFTEPLPKQVVEHQGTVGISVIDPYAEDPDDLPVVEALKVVKALPPVRRRKPSVPQLPVAPVLTEPAATDCALSAVTGVPANGAPPSTPEAP